MDELDCVANMHSSESPLVELSSVHEVRCMPLTTNSLLGTNHPSSKLFFTDIFLQEIFDLKQPMQKENKNSGQKHSL